jgi:hypothetical protein
MIRERIKCQCGELATVQLYRNFILFLWVPQNADFFEEDDEFVSEDIYICADCFEKYFPGIWSHYPKPTDGDNSNGE